MRMDTFQQMLTAWSTPKCSGKCSGRWAGRRRPRVYAGRNKTRPKKSIPSLSSSMVHIHADLSSVLSTRQTSSHCVPTTTSETGLLLSPFYSRGRWGWGRWSDPYHLIQLISRRSWIWIQLPDSEALVLPTHSLPRSEIPVWEPQVLWDTEPVSSQGSSGWSVWGYSGMKQRGVWALWATPRQDTH